VAAALDCQAEIEINSITPAVVNDPELTLRVLASVRRYWPDQAIDSTYRSMVSEDMAFMMQQIPGCYLYVGSANLDKGLDAPHHHPRFNIDEDALPRAAALIAQAAVELLKA